MKRKRILSILLVCLLTVSVAACGGKNGKDEAKASSGNNTAQGGEDASQGGGTADEQKESGTQSAWVEPEKEEPALDWSAVEFAPEEDFYFYGKKVSGNKGVVIAEYLGEGGVVKIPSTLGGEPVVMIDSNVFSESGVTDVYFEAEEFVYIEPYAFAECTTLNSVVIKGNEETEIRAHAFADCSNLTSVVFSEEIEKIWEAVFWGTPWLENKKQETPLVIVNRTVIDATLCTGDLVIPDGIVKIGRYAAWENENITSLTVPDSVERIEVAAFAQCTYLTRVSLPDGIHTISGPYGFAGDEDIIITHMGIEYTYEELEELDNKIWMDHLNSLP